MFDDKWLKLEPDDYVIDASNNNDGSVCLLLLIGLDGPYSIFGTPLIKGYYTSHIMEGNGVAKLKIAPNNISSKPVPFEGGTPNQFFDFNKRGASTPNSGSSGVVWVYIMEAICLIGLILLFVYVALPAMKNSFENQAGDSYNQGMVILCSILYFFGVGLFEMYVIEPLFFKAFVRGTLK